MFFICMALVIIMFTKRWTPIRKIDRGAHLNLVIINISAGADILDLTDYGNREDVTNIFNGVDEIYC